jgi:hypothetical protein
MFPVAAVFPAINQRNDDGEQNLQSNKKRRKRFIDFVEQEGHVDHKSRVQELEKGDYQGHYRKIRVRKVNKN